MEAKQTIQKELHRESKEEVSISVPLYDEDAFDWLQRHAPVCHQHGRPVPECAVAACLHQPGPAIQPTGRLRKQRDSQLPLSLGRHADQNLPGASTATITNIGTQTKTIPINVITRGQHKRRMQYAASKTHRSERTAAPRIDRQGLASQTASAQP